MLRVTLSFLVFSNVWVSLGASCLTLLTFKLFEIKPDFNFLFFVFFSTLFSYNFQRISRLSALQELAPSLWINSHVRESKTILILSAFGALYFNPIVEHPFSLVPLSLLAIISFAYSYKKLRNIPFLKIFLIAGSWSVLCGLMPYHFSPSWQKLGFIQSFSWLFFYILAITIPFDIRDLPIDKSSTKTFPQLLGIRVSKWMALLFLLVSFICLATFVSLHTLSLFLVSFILAGVLIVSSSTTKKPLYFGLLVDGHIILQFLMVYFLG